MSGLERVTAIVRSRAGRAERLAAFVQDYLTEPDFVPLLRQLPPRLRLAAAARALEQLPDEPRSVQPIVDALTQGLGKSRTLQTLIELQSRLAANRTVDALVAAAEARTKLACPKCAAKLTRPNFIRHLWFEHTLVFERGRAREPGPMIEAAIQQAIATQDPRDLDRVYALSLQGFAHVEPVQVHQAIVSRQDALPEDLQPLRERAAERHAGLCPRCYTPLMGPPPLPPPLAVSETRVIGDGYEHEVKPPSPLPPRLAALATFFLVALSPWPWTMLVLGTLATVGLLLRPTVPANVVDDAWRRLVPRVGRSPAAVRFLTRLCRSSLNHGVPEDRTEPVWTLFEQAALLSGKGPAQQQLFAAVSVLRAHDAGTFGGDWLPAVVARIAPLFRAEAPPAFADAIAQVIHESDRLDDPAAARLRILLVQEAFASGLSPADLVAILAVAPHLERLFAGTEEWFETLHALWTRTFAFGVRVFEFAANPASGSTLANYPDTFIVDRFEESYDRELGPILVGRRGVTLASVTASDLNTAIEVRPAGDGSELLFAGQSLMTRRRLPKRVAETLTNWLQAREELLTRVKGSERTARLKAILAPAVVECHLCRTKSVTRVGNVNAEWIDSPPLREGRGEGGR